MSNDKVEATFHPDDEKPETVDVPGTVHMKPDDPTAIPHAHLDEH